MIKFKELDFKVNQIHLSSDLHGFHKNICQGISRWPKDSGQRPFANEEEMTQHIVDLINANVKENDLYIHGGDWSFGGIQNIRRLREMIICKNIICIRGNHDHHKKEFQDLVEEGKLLSFEDNGYYQSQGVLLFCSHYPHLLWHRSAKGALNIFGHVHGSNPGVGKSLDVGIDNAKKILNSYRPFKLEEVIEICSSKQIS